MAIKGLTLLLVTFAFYNSAVMGATDCTLPWLHEKSIVGDVKSLTINSCPTPLIGDPNKEYCCYNTDGKVECCDFKEFSIFVLILLIPVLIILLILSSIISCICCLCCPCCAIYKRRQGGRVLVQPPTNFVFVETIPNSILSQQSYYYPASASTGSTPLIPPNEYSKKF